MIIVFNPKAGRRRTALLWRVLDLLVMHGVRLDVVQTAHPEHAAELARDAGLRGVRLIVAAGGDGTIAEVSRGIQGTGAALGIIPLGTANVLAREMGIPFNPEGCAGVLVSGRTRSLWPGLVSRASGEGRLFVQMCGVGFDAAVVHNLSTTLKRWTGRNAFVAQTLREMLRYRFAPMTVRIDGRRFEASSVVVTKGRLYAGPYTLAPAARPAEPGFQVALFGGHGRLGGPMGAAVYGAALVLNALPRAPGLRILPAEEVEVDSVLPVQADGDAAGAAPVRIVNAPERIEVVTGER